MHRLKTKLVAEAFPIKASDHTLTNAGRRPIPNL